MHIKLVIRDGFTAIQQTNKFNNTYNQYIDCRLVSWPIVPGIVPVREFELSIQTIYATNILNYTI